MANNENSDKMLREHLVYLLRDGGAHAKFDDVVSDFPEKARGKKPKELPYSAWMLLEHMRLAQWDILEFSRNKDHVSPPWPDGYWPKSPEPADDAAWDQSVREFKKDLKAIEDLVRNPKTDLYAKIPWGDGQTILREALLVADHNAYHLGQLVTVRRLLGEWEE
jgi:DinB family protein